MADFVVLEHLDGDRRLVRVVGGEHDNLLLVVSRNFRGRARHISWYLGGASPHESDFQLEGPGGTIAEASHDRRGPDFKASELLESLLTDEQCADWRCRRRFWVDTPRGPVELGDLHNLAFRDSAGVRLILCVEPEDSHDMPDADIWTNLLLVLRAEPEHFFSVANWRHRYGPDRRWRAGPVPVFARRPRQRQRPPPDPMQGILF
jgi:hypothetical protein